MAITACAPAAAATEEVPNIDEQPTHISVDLTPAQRAALTALSEQLNLSADKITLVSTEAVEWPDGCLGIVRMGVMCTQAVVPGFKIILEANAQKYEFHTNQDGSVVMLAESAQDSAEVEQALIKQLAANLGIKESDISVASRTTIEFNDACMGVAMEGASVLK
jgi:2C-methyl-D-erythritol 2,4-cyclodiphosphate synthase